MRLICPNCAAQYEVPDSVIPAAGRDVQCSNCGTTWFQQAAGAIDAAAMAPAPRPSTDEAREGARERAPDATGPAAQPVPAPEGMAADQTPDDLSDPDHDTWDDAPQLATPPMSQMQPTRRPLDPALADLLREEAAREARVRAAEAARAAPLETQTELGLTPPVEDEASRRIREARERLARLRGPEAAAQTAPETRPEPPGAVQVRRIVRPTATAQDSAPPAATPQQPSSRAPSQAPAQAPSQAGVQAAPLSAASSAALTRRELLPDIEEINSSLRVGQDRRPAEAADHDLPGTPAPRGARPAAPARSGFLRGFMIPVVLACALGAVYAQAPQLAARFPDLAGPLQAYTAQVTDLRQRLDDQAQGLLIWLDGIAAQNAGQSTGQSTGQNPGQNTGG